MKKAIEDITKSSHKLAEVMYQNSQQASGAPEAGGAAANGGETPPQDGNQGADSDNVVDAEFEDKN